MGSLDTARVFTARLQEEVGVDEAANFGTEAKKAWLWQDLTNSKCA